MKIGIKYCGGCNQRYDRTNFVKKLMEEYKEELFENAVNSAFYDIVLVICGCSCACASHDSLKGKQKLIVTGEADLLRIKEVFDDLKIKNN